MRILRLAVVCCLISTFAAFPSEIRAIEINGKCRVPDVAEAYRNSAAVFTGRILSVAADGDVKTFTFKVEKYWKGASDREIEINVQQTMRYQAWFEVGGSYLVFARGSEDNDQLWEVRCSRTKLLAEASDDIAKLGRAKKPAGKN